MVDRWVGGADVYAFESWNAALMGQLTGDAKYCTAAVTSSANQTQTWSLAFPTRPTINGAQTQVTAPGHTLVVNRLAPDAGPTATIHDYASNSDFTNGFRLDEQLAGGDRRWLHVAYIDGAVTAQSAPDANTVQLTLAGGTTVRVAFDPNRVGGTLAIGSSAVTLGAGVDSLPE